MPPAKLSEASPQPAPVCKRKGSVSTHNNDDPVSARRLKKREIDRRCQRQARERTRARITYLETLVEELRNPQGDKRSAALMKRLEETEMDRDALSQTLRDVQKALQTYEAGDRKTERLEGSPDIKNASPTNEGSDGEPVDIHGSHSFSTQYIQSRPSVGSSGAPIDTPTAPTPQYTPITEPMESTGTVTDEPIVPVVCNDACDCCRDIRESTNGQPKNLWRYANTTLLEPYKGHSPITPEEDMLADDTPVRVVIEGWDAVEQQIGLPVSWKILRRIDESLFKTCGPVNRLAVLTTMHMLLQYHRDPSPERCAKIPPWYIRRPSSETQRHSYAINFFVWPGLRERFVFHQHHYCANIFWQLFAASLNVSWPYDFRDCFAQRWDTDTYEISPLFKSCISEISNWQMRGDLFELYPELRCDIPATIQTPRPMSNLLQQQMANANQYPQRRIKRPMLDKGRILVADRSEAQVPDLFPFGAAGHATAAPWMAMPWLA